MVAVALLVATVVMLGTDSVSPGETLVDPLAKNVLQICVPLEES